MYGEDGEREGGGGCVRSLFTACLGGEWSCGDDGGV